MDKNFKEQNEQSHKEYEKFTRLLDDFFLDVESQKFKDIERSKTAYIDGLRKSGLCVIDKETQVEFFNRLSIEAAMDFGIRLGYQIFNHIAHPTYG